MHKLFKSKKGVSVDGLIGLLIGIIVIAAVLGATISLMFNGLNDVANNITAEGGAVGGLAVLFLTVLPILLVVFLFILFRKMMKV